MKTRVTLTCASLLALTLVACGDDMNSSDNSDATETTNDATETTNAVDSPDDTTEVTGDVDERIDVAQQALEDGDFSLFLEALDLSGVADEVRDEEMTILAPNDNAFGELEGSEYSDLLTNPTKIDDVVKRHLIEGIFTYEDLTGMTEVTTMGDETLTVSFADGVLTIGGATVLEPADDAVSGEEGQEVVVLEIDTVLLEAS